MCVPGKGSRRRTATAQSVKVIAIHARYLKSALAVVTTQGRLYRDSVSIVTQGATTRASSAKATILKCA